MTATVDKCYDDKCSADSDVKVEARWYRRLLGRTFHAALKALVGVDVRDTQCGFKLFEGDVARTLRERLPCQRVCASVIGWAVRHAHVHLLPTDAPGQVPGLDGPPLDRAAAAALLARLRGA